MEIQSPLTIEEMQEASVLAAPRLLRGRMHRRSQNVLYPSKWKLALMAAAVVFLLVQLVQNPELSGGARWIPAVVLVGAVGYQYLLGPKVVRNSYARRIARAPRIVCVDLDGAYEVDTAERPQFHLWSSYQTWREGSLIFLLRGPQRVSSIIPKRGLTPEQIDAIRVLLAMHMPDSA
jgi:hypothetical protein